MEDNGGSLNNGQSVGGRAGGEGSNPFSRTMNKWLVIIACIAAAEHSVAIVVGLVYLIKPVIKKRIDRKRKEKLEKEEAEYISAFGLSYGGPRIRNIN